MPDEEGNSQESVETPQVEAPVVETQDHSTENEANPFWGEVEKSVGPNTFKLIQPHLNKADEEARNRISKLNESYSPWKAFADQGVTPDHVNQAFQYVQRIQENPEEVYEALGAFLEREGRLPNKQELQQEIDDADDPEEDPRDREIRELREQQERLSSFFEEQEQAKALEKATQEADAWLAGEMGRVAKENPDFTDDDRKEIVRYMTIQVNQGQEPDIDAAVQQFTALRDRIRSVPRPGQLAPRLPGGAGGNPAGGPVNVGTMSKQDRIALAAQMLGK